MPGVTCTVRGVPGVLRPERAADRSGATAGLPAQPCSPIPPSMQPPSSRMQSALGPAAATETSFGSSNDILGFFDKLGNLEYDFLALLNSILAKTDVILVELDLIGMF